MRARHWISAAAALLSSCAVLAAWQEPDDFDAHARPIGSAGAKVRFHSIQSPDARWKPDGTKIPPPKRSIRDLPDFGRLTDGQRLWVEMRLKPEDVGNYDFRFIEEGKTKPQVYNSVSWENKGDFALMMIGSDFNFPAEQERVKFQFGIAEGDRTVAARYFYKEGKVVKAEGSEYKPKITFGKEYGSNQMKLIIDVPPVQSVRYAVVAEIYKTNGQPMDGFLSNGAHQIEFRFSYSTPHPPLGKVVVYTTPLQWTTFEGTLKPK